MTSENQQREEPDECNITLFSKESDSEIFMVEALGSAVIDTACTRTVCGEKWLNNYVEGLNESEVQKVRNTVSNRPFKFGDGHVVHSTKKVKASLKRAGTVLDLENDTAIMFKQQLALEVTSSGHYCINISDKDSPSDTYENIVLAITDNMSEGQKHKALLKLHKQFGHASVDKLKKLLMNAGNVDDKNIAILEGL